MISIKTGAIFALAASASAFPKFLPRGLSSDRIETVEKRDDDTCTKYPLGAGPVPLEDTPEVFLACEDFSQAALSAETPAGYSGVFTNMQASSEAEGFLTAISLQSYDVGKCASVCDTLDECTSFNIYYERNPTLDPENCTDPPSTTFIQCAFWSSALPETPTNKGQWRSDFHVVIAGSNGYTCSDDSNPDDPDDCNPDYCNTDDYNPDDYNPDDYNPDDYNPDDYNPDDYNPDDYNPDDYNPDGYNPDGYNPDDYNPDDYNPDDYNPDDYNPDDYNPDDYNPDGYNPDGYKPDDYNPDDYNPDDYNPDDYNPDGYNPDDYNPDDYNPNDSNPDDCNPDDCNPDDSNPDDPDDDDDTDDDDDGMDFEPEFYPDGGAIKADLNCHNESTHIGDKRYNVTSVNPARCAMSCNLLTLWNTENPPFDGSAPQVCNFFNTYLVSVNGVPREQVCAMYTQPWPAHFATNLGEWRSVDKYEHSDSWGYTRTGYECDEPCPLYEDDGL